MILYYSNSDKAFGPQTDPHKSIGGYVSSSILQNGTLNNVFGSIMYSEFYKERAEYRMIVLKNTISDISNLNIFFSNISENNLSNYKIGFTNFSLDNCNNPIFEKLASSYSKPFGVPSFNFFDENSKGIIQNFPLNSYLGIWIERIISKNKASELLNFCQLSSIPENIDIQLEQKDYIELAIEWQ